MHEKRLFAVLSMLALVVLLAVTVAPMYAQADAGDFNDYGGGGGDSGGWGSDSDSSGSSEWTGSPGQIIAVVLAGGFVLFVVITMIRQKRKEKLTGGAGGGVLRDHTNEIVPAILEIDPLFSSDRFIAWVKEVFFTLQYAWMARDWEKVRPFEKEELYRQHEQQLQ